MPIVFRFPTIFTATTRFPSLQYKTWLVSTKLTWMSFKVAVRCLCTLSTLNCWVVTNASGNDHWIQIRSCANTFIFCALYYVMLPKSLIRFPFLKTLSTCAWKNLHYHLVVQFIVIFYALLRADVMLTMRSLTCGTLSRAHISLRSWFGREGICACCIITALRYFSVRSSWQWREISYGNDLLTIENAAAGIYYVTVYAASESAFYLTGGQFGSTHWLMAGVAVTQSLNKGGIMCHSAVVFLPASPFLWLHASVRFHHTYAMFFELYYISVAVFLPRGLWTPIEPMSLLILVFAISKCKRYGYRQWLLCK